jgi:hypothetical protein
MTLSDYVRSFWWQGLAALRIPGPVIKVRNERDTLRDIGERRASIARFGDGELMIMLGYGIYFQEYDPELARRLRIILRSPTRQFLVGVPNFDAHNIKIDSRKAIWERYRRLFSHLVNPAAEYHSSAVSRPNTVVGLDLAAHYRNFAAVWAGRDVVLVHHAAITGHALFREARSVRHVPCLAEHAFREYPALLERAAVLFDNENTIFVIAAGPAAGVLAWDLAQRGAQALDVGHLTSAYDEFMQKQ